MNFSPQEFMLIRDLLDKSKDIEKMSRGEYNAFESLRTKFNLPRLNLIKRGSGEACKRESMESYRGSYFLNGG